VRIRLYWIAVALVTSPVLVCAQTDEIQVYDAAIAEQGKFNLMIHNNFTPDGRKTPAFAGALNRTMRWLGLPNGRMG